MYTDFITTSANIILPTNIVELSTYDFCNWLDHHIFKDTSLPPLSTPTFVDGTGYNFIYPLTAYGGVFFNSPTESKTISGGPFYDICYQDFCFEQFSINPVNIFCVSNVSFILSALDESQSRIIQLIYDFGDSTDLLVKNFNYLLPVTARPFLKEQLVTHTYYPTESFVTAYVPKITALYEDGCISSINLLLCCYKCGLFGTFDSVSLLDASQTKETRTILLTYEDKKRWQVFSNTLNLDALVPEIEGIVSPVANTLPSTNLTIVRAPSARVRFTNPIKVDPITYEYVEGPGINLTPDLLQLSPGDVIQSLSGDIISTQDMGAPYILGDGIIVQSGLSRNLIGD